MDLSQVLHEPAIHSGSAFKRKILSKILKWNLNRIITWLINSYSKNITWMVCNGRKSFLWCEQKCFPRECSSWNIFFCSFLEWTSILMELSSKLSSQYLHKPSLNKSLSSYLSPEQKTGNFSQSKNYFTSCKMTLEKKSSFVSKVLQSRWINIFHVNESDFMEIIFRQSKKKNFFCFPYKFHLRVYLRSFVRFVWKVFSIEIQFHFNTDQKKKFTTCRVTPSE